LELGNKDGLQRSYGNQALILQAWGWGETLPNDRRPQTQRSGELFLSGDRHHPAMCMRLPNLGSQYIGTFYDAKGEAFDGAKTYKLVLPKDIPAGKFWSLTLYDNQTRSMLQTDQQYPRAGSQSYPSPAATAKNDGSTVIYFSPRKPDGIEAGNWIQTDPDKGWFVLFRFYSPLAPFFDKSWRPGEIEKVN
jgi:hypothetical protein